MGIKIIEWNLNHRLNYGKVATPGWVAEIISTYDADIAVLTECCNRVPNWEVAKSKAFPKEKYYTFSSNNNQANNNDVIIAIKKEKIEVLSINSLFSEEHKAPDHLQIKCKLKKSNKIFVIAGIRIHAAEIKDYEKIDQFQLVLNELENESSVIIVGDFNCNRRSFTNTDSWNLNKIDNIINKKYIRVTPTGSSWARDVSTNDEHCFALDHFLLKGISAITLNDYDRSFVKKNVIVYKWGKDFQTKCGWQNEENNISAPYPDHAILSCVLKI